MIKENDVIVGTPVIYWKIIKKDGQRFDPVKTEITSEPWALGHGDLVCKVKGISGGVLISHLDLITTGSLMAAMVSGLTDITNSDIQESTTKFFSDRGVNVKVSQE